MSADPIVVAGSGPSGLHFAQTALEKGRRVLLLDVGYQRPEPVLPDRTFRQLREQLEDPVAWLLGENYETLILPDAGDYYGVPPSKEYVYREVPGFESRSDGLSPHFSFAQGGLAEAWTSGCYPFNDAELGPFPFGYDELGPFYDRVARRIGVSGARDDLARFFPVHAGLQPALDLDHHSRRLLERYEHKRAWFQERQSCYVGRSRLATLSRDHAGRPACDYTGRCLWGCPTDALYTPIVTLRDCLERDGFEYRSGLLVEHFRFDASGAVRSVVARSVDGGQHEEIEVGTLVLAAGTLASCKILLDSLLEDGGGPIPELGGLMDNRQVLMPFVNLKLLGSAFDPDSFQYNLVAMGLDLGGPREYVHGLVTTLKTGLIHPVVQSIPTSLHTALRAFRDLHAALGLVNINHADWRRPENRLGIERDPASGCTRLVVTYRPPAGETERLEAINARFRRILRKLGCVAPKGMTTPRPMGASVHYSGAIPMTHDAGEGPTLDPHGRHRDFENLYFVDGTGFPELPAKNLTFTLMANAARIADAVL